MNTYQITVKLNGFEPKQLTVYARNISEFKESVLDLIRSGNQVTIHQLLEVQTDWADEVAAELVNA